MASPLLSQSLTYDRASRLETVSDGADSATYSYLANSAIVEQIVFKHNGVARMTTSKRFDALNRLVSIESRTDGGVISSHAYDYNRAHQRTRAALADGSRWDYGYDDLGQVVAGKRTWSSGTPAEGEQFEYGYDDIGNRTRTVPGEANLGLEDLVSDQYQANALNQYTYRTSQKGKDKQVVAQEGFAHDADGNLVQDSQWIYTWDGENRLIAMESLPGTPIGNKLRLEFAYDSQGRRIGKQVYAWSADRWALTSDLRFVYDGWNLVAILTSDLRPLTSFLWGLDLSGSAQGAGGVGGLLSFTDHFSSGGSHYAAYDGNGNVVALVWSADGSITATYAYGPFGETVRVSGPAAGINPFRFSTKYTDDETGLLYYGYRFYQTIKGGWLSRDPLMEEGGVHLYAFVNNSPITSVDAFGLWAFYDHTTLMNHTLALMSEYTTTWGITCTSRIASSINTASINQDSAYSSDLKRHYNRGPNEDRQTAENNYQTYLATNRTAISTLLQGNPTTKEQCKTALDRIGRQAHSTQDFFIHAIRRDYGGEQENSITNGWGAWRNGVTGTPDDTSNFYPSSWVLLGTYEHPGYGIEPIVATSPEWPLRWNAAIDYSYALYVSLLQEWTGTDECLCYCRSPFW